VTKQISELEKPATAAAAAAASTVQHATLYSNGNRTMSAERIKCWSQPHA